MNYSIIHRRNIMKKSIKSIALGCVVATALISTNAMANDSIGAAIFNDKGELKLPVDFRKWVFIGAPLTPHGLNNGKAGFPEFHHVYVNPDAYSVYERTGEFPEGTVITKELVLLQKGKYRDGSTTAPSGRGFFAEKFNGLDVMVKDSNRFKDTHGWGFFNYGHKKPPYLKTAKAASTAECAGCHRSNAGKDMVFKKYYPILNQ
jgi:hypothetical protein